MYLDNNLIVAGSITAAGVVAGQSMSGTDTSVLSTYGIDLQNAKDIGAGNPELRMRVLILTAASGGTSEEFQAIGATAGALNAGVVVLGSTGAIAVASVSVGARFEVALNPRISAVTLRYLGARAVTVGAVTATVALIDFGVGVEDNKSYPSGFAIA